MIGFILTGHGHFSNGLKSSVDMVAGPQEKFEIVPFEEEAAGAYADKLREAVTAMRNDTDGVLVFVDLMGGTPFNQSMLLTSQLDNIAWPAPTCRCSSTSSWPAPTPPPSPSSSTRP